MTNPFEDKNLTREKLRQLITASEKHVERDEPAADMPEFDWQVPHHFNPEELGMLDSFSRKLALQINKTLMTMCEGEFEVDITNTEQHFACNLSDLVFKEQGNYLFLSFNDPEGNPHGYISISPETAHILIGQMLRDSDSANDTNRELSRLEESILMDVVAAIVDSFTDTLKETGAVTLRRTSRFSKGDWPLDVDGLNDLCSISFVANNPEGAIEATITILSNLLEPVVGSKAIQDPNPTPQKLANMLMQAMQEVPIEASAQLCLSSVSLNDFMNLQPGDTLLLDKKTDEPIDLLLNNHPSFKAYPTKSLGKHAVVITKPEEE